MSLKKRFEVLNIGNKVFPWNRPGHSGWVSDSGRFLSGPDHRHLDPTRYLEILASGSSRFMSGLNRLLSIIPIPVIFGYISGSERFGYGSVHVGFGSVLVYNSNTCNFRVYFRSRTICVRVGSSWVRVYNSNTRNF